MALSQSKGKKTLTKKKLDEFNKATTMDCMSEEDSEEIERCLINIVLRAHE